MVRIAETLYDCEETTCWPYEISARMGGVSGGSLFQALQKMLDSGYVTRSPESHDSWIDRTDRERRQRSDMGVDHTRRRSGEGRGRRRTLYTLTWRGKRMVRGARSDNQAGDLAICRGCEGIIVKTGSLWEHDTSFTDLTRMPDRHDGHQAEVRV
jgi:DNA-binding PadR family transcriptional regulator